MVNTDHVPNTVHIFLKHPVDNIKVQLLTAYVLKCPCLSNSMECWEYFCIL